MTETQRGFTLLEVLCVIVLVGIVAAIASPSWFGYLEKTRVVTATGQLHTALRDAQSTAQYQKTPRQFSLRDNGGVVEWAVHSTSVLPSMAQWQAVESASIQIDDETTFVSSGGVYYVRFDEHGNPHRLGRVTLSGQQFSTIKRCVIVSTLIGAMRTSNEQSTPDPNYRRRDRFCY